MFVKNLWVLIIKLAQIKIITIIAFKIFKVNISSNFIK